MSILFLMREKRKGLDLSGWGDREAIGGIKAGEIIIRIYFL